LRNSVLVALFILLFATTAYTKGNFYLGAWRLESAVVAPWADPHEKPDAAAMQALIGKIVTLIPAAITGPKPFACKGPHYKLSNFTADMLFQGSFGEMHDKNKSADPQKIAASLGFSGTSFMTLETGCEIDWHFVNPGTAEVGLDNYVYTLKRQ
jgi:hypothetical protein